MFPHSPHRGTRHRRLLLPLAILGVLILAGQTAGAAPSNSDWPALNADAAQSNYNPSETSISAHNVLKLKVKWTAAIPDVSYPVVAGGHVYLPVAAGTAVHARALDVETGKATTTYSKGAIGGLLAAHGNLYIAGRSLEVLNPDTGDVVAAIKGPSKSSHATFTNPLTTGSIVVAGYASESGTAPNAVYALDAATNHVLWHAPSLNAQVSAARGRIVTQTDAGSAFYNKKNGKQVSVQPAMWSDWFAEGSMAYSVATLKGKNATLYAFNKAGRAIWSRTVGPQIDARGWAHAAGPNAVFVATLKPHDGLEALNPSTGVVLWKHNLAGVQRLALANNLLFALTTGIGQPVRLVVFHAGTGKSVGTVALSGGFYAFPEPNELMIADGMVFIRAIGPSGDTELVALGR